MNNSLCKPNSCEGVQLISDHEAVSEFEQIPQYFNTSKEKPFGCQKERRTM